MKLRMNAVTKWCLGFTLLVGLAGTSLGADAPNVHRVSIKGMQFVPANLTLAVGDEVIWSNNDIVPHTATGEGFDSGEIGFGKSWSMKVKTAGDLAYRCRFHPTMVGQLQVTPKVTKK